MPHKFRLALSIVVILVVASLVYYLLANRPEATPIRTVKATRHDLKVIISTNGIIEPADDGEIYSPLDAFIVEIHAAEGRRVEKGQPLFRLESQSLRTALAEARTALLEAQRQARLVFTGPLKEELAALDASIAECAMQLEQAEKELKLEEELFSKNATPLAAVENLRRQRDLLKTRLDGLKRQRTDLAQRYSAEEKEWEQKKLSELSRQVALLERQMAMEVVAAPKSGVLYSLPVKRGAYVGRGNLLAKVYEPGDTRLRAYVDEPDLGRIVKGQAVVIEWDGMPDRQWTGKVERPAEQVVTLNNRSIGHVLCTIDGESTELIPNLNVKVQITTAMKSNVVVIPRSSAIRQGGKTLVLVSEGKRIVPRPVELGLVTPEEIEVVRGINAGDSVVLNPGEANLNP